MNITTNSPEVDVPAKDKRAMEGGAYWGFIE
jgi:hypothetical protein